jgi:hypothetical protein
MSLKHGVTTRTREGTWNTGEKVSWERLLIPVQKKSRTGLEVNNNLLLHSCCLFRSSYQNRETGKNRPECLGSDSAII